MPLYEYACQQCGQMVELLQKMGTNAAGTACPACGSEALVKQWSVSAPAQVVRSGGTACGGKASSAVCGQCGHGCQQ